MREKGFLVTPNCPNRLKKAPERNTNSSRLVDDMVRYSVGVFIVVILAVLSTDTNGFHVKNNAIRSSFHPLLSTITSDAPSSPWFTEDGSSSSSSSSGGVGGVVETTISSSSSKEKLKVQILQLGASLDRGQSYNPTSGEYYSASMDIARSKILSLIALADTETNIPTTLSDIAGEWELIFTTVKHGIFRSSPFFLAVQEAFEYSDEKEAFGQDKATLFFKLHELQTCSW